MGAMHNQTMLRFVLTAVLCGVLAGEGVAGFAASWQPTKPLTLVVHASPGSGADLFARLVAKIVKDERLLPVAVEVLNRTGGRGAIAMNFVANKRGDPGVLMGVTTPFITAPLQQKGLPTYRDFLPVALMAEDTSAVQVLATSRYHTIHDLIEAARRQPNTVTLAFGAFGGTDHINGFQLGKAVGAQFRFVAFKGGGETVTQLLGGHIDFITSNPAETRALAQAGKVRVLAIMGEKRLAVFPDVPTLRELGINMGGTFAAFRGFVAPGGVPEEAIEAYGSLMRKVMEAAAWKRYVSDNDLVEEYLGPAQMVRFLEERERSLARALVEMGAVK